MSIEEYIIITDLVAGQKLYINKKEYEADDNGCVFLSESMLKGERGSPMEQYETKLNELLNDLQKMNFYRICGRSSGVILSSVVNALEGDRVLARKVLALGEGCGVLIRGHNYTWKVSSKIMKERMIMLEDRIGKLIGTVREEQTGDEYRQSVLDAHKNQTNEEENEEATETTEEVVKEVLPISVDTRVNETLKQYKSTLPALAETKKPKRGQTPTKKTPLGKPLVQTRKSR